MEKEDREPGLNRREAAVAEREAAVALGRPPLPSA
jgi:hypothetical protein